MGAINNKPKDGCILFSPSEIPLRLGVINNTLAFFISIPVNKSLTMH